MKVLDVLVHGLQEAGVQVVATPLPSDAALIHIIGCQARRGPPPASLVTTGSNLVILVPELITEPHLCKTQVF